MSADLPYVVAPGRFPDLLTKIQTAAVPERVTVELLKKLGFTSSNDRAYPGLLRRLGFIDLNGAPTERYRAYRQKSSSGRILADAVRETFSELFAIDTAIHVQNREELKGAISRVTGKDEALVDRIAGTFQMLAKAADWSAPPTGSELPDTSEAKSRGAKSKEKPPAYGEGSGPATNIGGHGMSFHYDIQIHLPATTDIAVYNAIFKSIRENLRD